MTRYIEGEDERPVHAAMEPAPWERDDSVSSCSGGFPVVMPQWSPLLGSGMTQDLRAGLQLVERAAMEPAPWERDDLFFPDRIGCALSGCRNGARSLGAG